MKKLIIYLSLVATVGFSADVILGRLQDLTWTGTGADRVASFATETPDVLDGLVAWWKFDEGTGLSAVDSIGSINNALTGGGDFVWGTGPSTGMGAVWYSGTNTYGVIVSTNLDYLSTSSWSMCGWMKNPNIPLNRSGLIQIHGSGLLFLSSFYCGMIQNSIEKTYALIPDPSSEWVFIAFSYDSSTTDEKILWDMTELTLLSGPDSWGITSGIGRGYNSTFQGWVSGIRIYNRVLTTNEFNTIYNKFR